MASKDLLGETTLACFHRATSADYCRAAAQFSAREIAADLSSAMRRHADETSESVYHEAISNMKSLGIDALVVLGGEGRWRSRTSLTSSAFLLSVCPKTIDNDLACTELTFGFITALDIATEALDRLHTTAESHERVMILEVMGRHTGWIALHSGIAGGADVILIPEIPFTMQSVADKIRARDASGSNFSIIVVAEGAIETGHDLIYQDKGDPQHAPRLGGIGRTATGTRRAHRQEKRVAWCWAICNEVAGPMLSIACWQRTMARAPCARW